MPHNFTYENFNAFILPGDDAMYDSLEPKDLIITTVVHQGRVSIPYANFKFPAPSYHEQCI